ncbi:16S rRNA m(7)G-527 methyltransferase [Georgenia satyanarayanai]|uniref:Ribosomal RNA small subunit methyltransferase G n=1 Tax=Georgenia satyanarayanai TaxID=860221 RepID=A0A2Y9AMX6_9MICO|nr:16S rRNA (guanine(527)-N(7))-methyltransferase RsmG [Georgenia satyanarayanai]PYF97745.1 16S rRNA m(7)G-527 methyltransferase [Georgenia satyanarayanai]SSA45485.1 16S rRNA m(7)G-527 methyltransferase [Georgenia satyanarayanai]
MTVERVPESAARVFGDSTATMGAFASLLAAEGELRGLIGPRELPRLWTRHLLNSSAVASFVPQGARFVDIGSGAGFPGVVVAIMRADLEVHLVEPMDRRTTWLEHVARELALSNVTVVRARAEELHGSAAYDVVSARAVAALKKLVPWTAPLVRPGGQLVALKGERAAAEVDEAAKTLRKYGLADPVVHEIVVEGTDELTRVVTAQKGN